MDLLAIEDVTQLLAIQPGTRGTLAGELGHQRIEVVTLLRVQLVAIFKQCPAQPLEIRIGFLFQPAHLVHCD